MCSGCPILPCRNSKPRQAVADEVSGVRFFLRLPPLASGLPANLFRFLGWDDVEFEDARRYQTRRGNHGRTRCKDFTSSPFSLCHGFLLSQVLETAGTLSIDGQMAAVKRSAAACPGRSPIRILPHPRVKKGWYFGTGKKRLGRTSRGVISGISVHRPGRRWVVARLTSGSFNVRIHHPLEEQPASMASA